VQGKWRGTLAGEKGEIALEIRQGFQLFDGRLVRNGHAVRLRDGRISGTNVSFTAVGDGGRRERYSATVRGGQMTGEVRNGETVIARWAATRLP
jgi:hypothetical protein